MEGIFDSVREGIPLLLNSPTGTGKTAMVLGGVLEAMSKDEKLAVITRTHSQYRMFIQEFMRVKRKHSNLKFGLLVGRGNVCPMNVDYDLCGLMRKNSLSRIKKGVVWYGRDWISSMGFTKPDELFCPYLINCFQEDQSKSLFNGEAMRLINDQLNNPVTPEKFFMYCVNRIYPKCPYELMKNTLSRSDVIVLHYHYLLDPNVRESVISSNWFGCGFEDVHLVVDEAHNLSAYLQDICSLEFSKKDVLDALQLVNEGKLYDIEYSLESIKKNIVDVVILLEDLNLFLYNWFSSKHNSELLGGLIEDVVSKEEMFKPDSESLERLYSAAESIRTQFHKKKQSLQIPDETPLPGICRVAEALKQILDKSEDRYIKMVSIKPLSKTVGETLDGRINIEDYDISMKIIDIDPRDAVKYLSDSFRSLTLLSGTLTPTKLYRKLLFYDEINTREMNISSPFPLENRFILCCKDTSSQRRLRENEMNRANIKECMKALFAVEGNIALFFTSYGLKEEYLSYSLGLSQRSGKELMDESRMINKHKFIEEYKNHGNAALLGVCRGSFSEGVDFTGEAMNAVAVIGLPLSQWNLKQKKINHYYERMFGRGAGKEIGYYLSAVTAAVQALGRCIRSPRERGILLLGDSRYCDVSSFGVMKLLPDWMQNEMQVIHSNEAESLITQKIKEWGSMQGPDLSKDSSVEDTLPPKTDSGRVDLNLTQLILETITETKSRFGSGLVSGILTGSKNKKIIGKGFNESKYYGVLSHLTQKQVLDKINDLISKDVIHRTRGRYPVLKITDKQDTINTYI